MAGALLPEEGAFVMAAVAIDRDKNSQFAVKWAIDNLHLNHQITLIHVLTQHSLLPHDAVPREGRAPTNNELQQFFLPFRGFCARKGVQATEVILNDIDIASSLSNYIIEHSITTIILGASNRSAISRAFKNFDVPTCLSKTVPDFCTVYVVSKGKALMAKEATRVFSSSNISSSWQASADSFQSVENTRSVERFSRQGSWKSSGSDKSYEGNPRKSYEWSRGQLNSATKNSCSPNTSQVSVNSSTLQRRNNGTPSHCPSSSTDFSGSQTMYSFENLDHSRTSDNSRFSVSSQVKVEIEDELRKLQQELKQTMDMYNSVCKEAFVATEKVRELDQWKSDEACKIAESKHAQEAALAMVEMERKKCMAALEAARMSQRMAELEAQKRKFAEMKFQQESEEKTKAIKALARCDLRYRKYTIEEIEVATKHFAVSEKIGEGGYGPVYKGHLDHTAVAIKVLRPDISQGQKQFQREIEVLSQMRHPNMVLLLGACPEYGCLVYEYMDKGSLEDCLFCRNGPPMSWRTRFRIAAEIATALLFFHQAKPEPLVHRDLKPANILLDRNYVSKIGDVGLSRLVPQSVDNVTEYHMTAAAGTFCYIDPEYQQTGMLGTKSDVYSLGIMFLQIITAMPAMGLTYHVEEAIENGRFAEILDPKVTDWPIEEALSFAKLSLKCSELRKKDRPDLGSEILPELERLRDLGADTEAKYRMPGHTMPSMESYADSVSYSQDTRSNGSEM